MVMQSFPRQVNGKTPHNFAGAQMSPKEWRSQMHFAESLHDFWGLCEEGVLVRDQAVLNHELLLRVLSCHKAHGFTRADRGRQRFPFSDSKEHVKHQSAQLIHRDATPG